MNKPPATAAMTVLPKLPKTPPPGLLVSMAFRYDQGLTIPGYYNELHMLTRGRTPTYQQKLDTALSLMRNIYEEISGHGAYTPEREAEYAALLASDGTPPTGRERQELEEVSV